MNLVKSLLPLIIIFPEVFCLYLNTPTNTTTIDFSPKNDTYIKELSQKYLARILAHHYDNSDDDDDDEDDLEENYYKSIDDRLKSYNNTNDNSTKFAVGATASFTSNTDFFLLNKLFKTIRNCDFYREVIEYSASLSQVAYCINDQNALRVFPDEDYKFVFPQELLNVTMVDYREEYNSKLMRYQLMLLIENENINDNSFFLGGGNGYVLIDHKSQKIDVVFRGSRSRADWLTNFSFVPITYQPLVTWKKDYYLALRKFGGPITNMASSSNRKRKNANDFLHLGFYQVASKIIDQVMFQLASTLELYPSYQITIQGHSLGGAIAQVVSLELAILNIDHFLITFNSPAIFSNDLAEFYNDLMKTSMLNEKVLNGIRKNDNDVLDNMLRRASFRVYHRRDIVPSISPPSVYRHTGYPLTIGKRNLPHFIWDFTHDQENVGANANLLEATGADDEVDALSVKGKIAKKITNKVSSKISNKIKNKIKNKIHRKNAKGTETDFQSVVQLAEAYDSVIQVEAKKVKKYLEDVYYYHRNIVVFFSACNEMSLNEEEID